MKKSIFHTVFFILALLSGTAGYAQNENSWYNQAKHSDKIAKQMVTQMKMAMTRANNSKGVGADGLIRSKVQYDTIALVTFSVNGHEAYARQMITGNKAWSWVTPEGAKHYANKFYQQSIQQMKADFKARGIVLLTPDEFLNTPQKIQAYKSFEAEIGGMNKLLGGGVGKGEIKSREAADGFTYIDFANIAMPTFSNSVGGTLAKELGVRMVLGVTLSIGPTDPKSKDMKVMEINWQVMGLNVFPKEDGMKEGGLRGYNDGNVYVQHKQTFGSKGEGIIFDYTQKKQKYEVYNGFEKIMSAFIKGTLDGFEEAIKKYGK